MTSEGRKGYRMLLTMFEICKTMTKRSDRECFNQVVRFLADYARVHPMPKEDHPVADRLISLAEPLLEAWFDEPYDYLGQLFSEKKCAIDEMGQVITPRSPNWRFANRWSPPDWQTEMVTLTGETYADWGRKRDLGEKPEEEVGQEVPPPVMTGTDELPLFRGLEGEQR